MDKFNTALRVASNTVSVSKTRRTGANAALHSPPASPYELRIFHKNLNYILTQQGKSLSWVSSYAGRTKTWWSLARAKRGRIVIRKSDVQTVKLLADVLREAGEIQESQLRARLEVTRLYGDLLKAIDKTLRTR